MRVLKVDEDSPGFSLEEYPKHFVQVFDLTSTQKAKVHTYYPEVVAAKLILELYFTSPPPSAIKVAVFRERLSKIFIEKLGLLWEMINDQLARKNSRIGILKHKYEGSFPADMILEIFPPGSFFYATMEPLKHPDHIG